MLSFSEENYLKCIYHLSKDGKEEINTNAIAEHLNTKPASVTDMIRKLDKKGVITYKKYQGVSLSRQGLAEALNVVRKHRLWEVFLVEKLKFNWDEVHDVAEQLEHIRSPLLIERLDKFLGSPQYDPHGDPIPDENGEFTSKNLIPVSAMEVNDEGIVMAVKDTEVKFLQYLDKLGAYLGAKIKVVEKIEFDGSMEIIIDKKRTVFISKEVSNNILIAE
ncbi:MAG: metal-dependent transcriptional regulator [Bacteroidota bacterium]|nr:metal-dependent transcriptional regulator [Bacteroidota bacterium]